MNRKYGYIRWCTGGCKNGEHFPHFYRTDPVDGPLGADYLCPGNAGPEVMELLDDSGEREGIGYINT